MDQILLIAARVPCTQPVRQQYCFAIDSKYMQTCSSVAVCDCEHNLCLNFLISKMLSETADFAPAAATWRTEQTVRVVFKSGLFPALYENNVIHKTGST